MRMNQTLTAILLVSLFAGAPYASAGYVDLKNANYSDSWTDLTLGSGATEISLKRAYNSRSVFPGKFGFGWVSHFEDALVVTDRYARYTIAGDGAEFHFVARDGRWIAEGRGEIVRTDAGFRIDFYENAANCGD